MAAVFCDVWAGDVTGILILLGILIFWLPIVIISRSALVYLRLQQ